MWFYDTGCSHLCMKNDVPRDEFDSTLLQQGPFNIGGVGGVQVMASASGFLPRLSINAGRYILLRICHKEEIHNSF